MRNWAILSALLLLLGDSSAEGQTSREIRLRAHLTDGGMLVGTTTAESITLKTAYGELTLPLSNVRRVEWEPQSQSAKVELENRDVISGKVAGDYLPINTLFGKVDLSHRHIHFLERLAPEASGWIPIRKGLVAYYSFDHGQDALGVDDASEKHRAEVSDAKWIKTGKRGGAAIFNGAATLSVPNADELNVAQGLTLSLWMKSSDERHGYAMIAGKTRGSSWSGGYGLARMSGDSENVYFFVNSYTGPAVKAAVAKGQWTHVAGTCDGQVVKIFVNGKLAESTRMTEGSSKTPIQKVDVPLMLGSDQSGYFWKGTLDEAALFDRALEETEIARLYDAGAFSIAGK
jgi:hypothetical protein